MGLYFFAVQENSRNILSISHSLARLKNYAEIRAIEETFKILLRNFSRLIKLRDPHESALVETFR